MKIKLDENIPASLTNQLALLGHDVDTVVAEALVGSTDEEIWDRCQDEQRFPITQDLDFSDSRKFRPGTHAGLLLVRLQNPGRATLHAVLMSIFRAHNVESWKNCFVVVSENKSARKKELVEASAQEQLNYF